MTAAVIECLDEAGDDLFTFRHCPKAQWKALPRARFASPCGHLNKRDAFAHKNAVSILESKANSRRVHHRPAEGPQQGLVVVGQFQSSSPAISSSDHT